MKRRILSIVMVLVMALSIQCAFTITEPQTVEAASSTPVAQANGVNYYSFDSAWAVAVRDGGTFKLLSSWRPSNKKFETDYEDYKDYFRSGALCVPENKSVTIDLNGYCISRGLYYAANDSVSNGEVIYLSKDASLTIKDTSPTGDGRIEDGNSSNGAGGIHAKPGSRIYMYGGQIAYCQTNNSFLFRGKGGGVYLDSGAKMYMYGGKLYKNIANGRGACGGAVYIDSDARFYMYGGEISYNKNAPVHIWNDGYAYFYGGTVKYNKGTDNGNDYYDYIINSGSIYSNLYIDGTEITKNEAKSIVYSEGNGYLRGGSIHDNIGNGVEIERYETYLGGDIKIYNNFSSDVNKDLLAKVNYSGSAATAHSVDPYPIKLETLRDGAKIGVYAADKFIEKSPLSKTENSGQYVKYFFSNRDDCRIVSGSDGLLYVKKISDVGEESFITGVSSVTSGGEAVIFDSAVTKEERTVTIHVPKNADVTSLAVSLTTSGTSAAAPISPESGSVRDFTSPVTYTLLNKDGKTEQNWTVAVVKDRDAINCKLNVTGGTGSGTYKVGSKVSVSADEVENKRFTSWSAEGISLTAEQAASQAFTFTMPSNDVTLTANYIDLTSVVELTIAQPSGGKALAEYASVKLNDGTESTVPVSWSPETSAAEFNSKYTAVVSFVSEYGFSSNLEVKLNGETITPLKPDSKTLVITKEFTTGSERLLSIPTAELIGVANGTLLENINLPSEINIVTESKLISTAEVTWDRSTATDYDPDNTQEQTFTIDGTITPPVGIDVSGAALDAQIRVTVSESGRAAAPTANLTSGAVYDTAPLLSLATTTEGADIYYTMDGSEPTVSSKKYESAITLASDIKNDKVYTVKAIAVSSDASLRESAVSEFKFTVIAPTYELKLVDESGNTAGLGGGIYYEGDSVSVQTAAMTKGFVFKSWSAEGIELTEEQLSSPSFTFTMPAVDVTLTANFIHTITNIELDIDSPTRGSALDTSAGYRLYNSVSTDYVKADESGLTIAWTPFDTAARTYTEYTATVILKPSYVNELIFDEEVTAAVDGANSVVCGKNADGSVTIIAAFVTEKAKLSEIIPPQNYVYKPYGASFEDYLPNTVKIVTDDADINMAYVEWNTGACENPEFDPDYDDGNSSKSVTVTGTVVLPEDVNDKDEYDIEIDTYVEIEVEVSSPYYSELPCVDVAPGVYSENKTVTLSVSDGSTIYYKLNGGEEITYTQPIVITGAAGESVTTKITAYTINEDDPYMSSVEGAYVYTIELPAEKQTVTVINGTGSGEYDAEAAINIVAQPEGGKSFKSWIAEAVTYTTEEKEITETILDENGESKEVTTTQKVTTRNARTVDGCFENEERPVTTLTVPALNDGEILEVTAECAEAITAVSFRVAIPAAGEALPTAITSGTSGISIVADSFTITPADSNAKYNTRYTVSTDFTVADGYTLGETPSFSINGVSVQPTANDDGSYTVSYAFTTEDSITVGGVSAKATDGITVESYDGSVFAVVIDTEMFGGASDNSLYIQDIKVALKKSGETTYSASSESLSEYTYLDEEERYAVFPVAIDGEISADLAVRGMLETKPSHNSEGTSVYYISEDVFDVKSTATAE